MSKENNKMLMKIPINSAYLDLENVCMQLPINYNGKMSAYYMTDYIFIMNKFLITERILIIIL